MNRAVRTATFGSGNSLQIWDITSGKQIATFGSAASPAYDPVWSPNGKYIAASGIDNPKHLPTLQIWDAAQQTILLSTDVPNGQRSAMAWCPDSVRLFFTSSTGLAESLAMPSGGRAITYPGKSQWLNAGWSADVQHVAAGSYDSYIVQVWGASSAIPTYTYHGHAAAVQALAWSHTSSIIASSGDDGTVRVWQAA